MTMYVPVRPTPAEQWTIIGPAVGGLAAAERTTKDNTGNGWSGTPACQPTIATGKKRKEFSKKSSFSVNEMRPEQHNCEK